MKHTEGGGEKPAGVITSLSKNCTADKAQEQLTVWGTYHAHTHVHTYMHTGTHMHTYMYTQAHIVPKEPKLLFPPSFGN